MNAATPLDDAHRRRTVPRGRAATDNRSSDGSPNYAVRNRGVEPLRPFGHRNLKSLGTITSVQDDRDSDDLDAGAGTSLHDREGLAHPVAHVPDAVSTALEDAVAEAARAGRWDVVVQLARELAARRDGTR